MKIKIHRFVRSSFVIHIRQHTLFSIFTVGARGRLETISQITIFVLLQLLGK